MKVGIYLSGNLPESGGAYTFEQDILVSLSKLSDQTRHEFVVFWENKNLSQSAAIKSLGNLKIIPFVRQQKLLKLFRMIANRISWVKLASVLEDPLQKRAKAEGIDLMLFLTPIYGPIDIPYIANIWDIQHRLQPWFPEVSHKGAWVLREDFFSRYLGQASFIITPNQSGKQELSFFYQIPPERFRLLMHPTPEIDPMPSKDELEAVLLKYKISSGYLFYPAQFWPHKNHVNLLLALKQLRDKHQMSFQLVLVGSDKGNRQHIQDLAKEYGLIDQVHFLGFVPREDLIALYRGAFALIYVTLFGPENLPPLEAFACGCPVIASDVPGAEEQLGDAAFLVKGLSVDEIANAVKRLKDNPDLRNDLITRGRDRAAKFTARDFVKGLLGIFDEFEAVRRNWK